MIHLSREIRFSLTPPSDSKVGNSWAGWPSTNAIVPFLVLRCTIEGTPDPQTGYVCNIKLLDDLLRNIVQSRLIDSDTPTGTAESMVTTVWNEATDSWNSELPIQSIVLCVSPFLKYEIHHRANEQNEENEMASQALLQVTQQFEFSAAHRLHCEDFSEEKNKELFGKCNNPNGHGHNYVVEVSLAKPAMEEPNEIIGLSDFEKTVKEQVIDRLDHKHLNEDVDYFKQVIPSVENIAIAIWDWLDGQFESAKLSCIRVYETPKTWAEYRGSK